MNMEPLREFVSLDARKKELTADLAATNQRLEALEEVIISMLIENGVPGMDVKCAGVPTRYLSINEDIHASPLRDRSDVAAALKASDLGQYVAENYNTRSVEKMVRDLWKELRLEAQREKRVATVDEVRAALPTPLGAALKISLVYKLSNTISSKNT
jgi:hypothetical protein